MSSGKIIVVGAGIIGLSCAYELLRRGEHVEIVDPQLGRGATHAAAGMLAAVSETQFGETQHSPQLLAAAQLWPHFAQELEGKSGMDISFAKTGTLLIGVTHSDRAEVDRLADLHRGLGFEVREVDRSVLTAIEPALSPKISRGYLVDSDHQVNGRSVVKALAHLLEDQGAIITQASIRNVAERSDGVRLIDSNEMAHDADHVVIAVGAYLREIEGIANGSIPKVRGVKGEILRLRDGFHSLKHVLRTHVNGHQVYLVPRPDGELVVGATSLESRDDSTVRAGAIFDLLSDARNVFPGIDELNFIEASTGLRPARSTGAPFIAQTQSRVTIVGGHNRNGILLAPLTARVVASIVRGEDDSAIALFEVVT